jgi:NAD-dependent DNA ligase
MTTRDKLNTVNTLLLDIRPLVNSGSVRDDEWFRDKNIIDAIRDTLSSDSISAAEVKDCNRIWKAWKGWSTEIKQEEPSPKYDFHNKQFCFTGFRDTLLVNKLNTDYGSIVHTAVTGGTTLHYLICKDKSRTTVKMKKATDKGATILTYAEFKKLIKI